MKSICCAVVFLFAIVACDEEVATPAPETSEPAPKVAQPAGRNLTITDVVKKSDEECERRVEPNDKVSLHYIGQIVNDGTVFDSSYTRQEPVQFQVGSGSVIPAWEQGVVGMCIGDKRHVLVPPHLGYGKRGAGKQIPADADITFELEVTNIEDGMKMPNMWKMADRDDNGEITKQEMSNMMIKAMLDRKTDTGRRGKKRVLTEDEEEKLKQMVVHIVDQQFDRDDHNSDGVIEHHEFSGPKHGDRDEL